MGDQAARLRQLVDKSEYEVKMSVVPDAPTLSTLGPRVIAVTSGKGGVGKTNITVNLAIALRQAGQRVLVIDADLGMANVDVVLGSMSKKHLLNLLEKDTKLQDVMIDGPYGVRYISGGSGIEKAAEALAHRPHRHPPQAPGYGLPARLRQGRGLLPALFLDL